MSADLRKYTQPHVAICIATFMRPQGLKALIQSLNAQVIRDRLAWVTLVIVDNAPDALAEQTLGDIQDLTHWPVIYAVEPTRGIVAARNRCLAKVPADADYIAFLDDDESVSETWLEEMLGTIALPDTVAVQGPVEPKFRQPPPGWVEALSLFRMGPYNQGARINSAATNNSMVDADVVRKLGLRFDPRFNITGGEDEEFYTRLRESGGTIRAAAQALVWDDVPESRTTLRWIGRRWFRKGNTLGRIALIRRQGVAMRVVKGVGAIGWGCLTCLCLGFGSRSRWYRGVLEVYRGAGMLAALAHVEFAEYSSSAVAADRPGGH
ncbi:glycosyltransferase [Ruegeria sp. R14_0]|uniref:glycosyltransferase family 2 protein n=1 Tax=Ruegeria sp. R14_0 TaxID=2821100 RepID=UPI001ADA97B0|nr:glycosyltransferase [Ruegeria sp. R14_0]MBO9445913.1 glycosyltransferase [Ruegeria sp. R14_0]